MPIVHVTRNSSFKIIYNAEHFEKPGYEVNAFTKSWATVASNINRAKVTSKVSYAL
jgi:hypothetical protein